MQFFLQTKVNENLKAHAYQATCLSLGIFSIYQLLQVSPLFNGIRDHYVIYLHLGCKVTLQECQVQHSTVKCSVFKQNTVNVGETYFGEDLPTQI